MGNPIRLNKFLAERLGISRREADEAISHGKVKINGKTAVLGARIDFASTGDEEYGRVTSPKGDPRESRAGEEATVGPAQKPIITYDSKIVSFGTNYLYLAMNKPVGYVCSRRAQGSAPTLYDLLPKKYQKLKTVGRLDKDSSGLILLTNDGNFAFQMTHPKFHKEKVYKVELNKPLQPLHQQMISDYGIMLDDGPSKFLIIKNESGPPLLRTMPDQRGGNERANPATTGANEARPKKMAEQARYIVKLSEGRNRQIRRTFAALGYRVTKLHRIQFGNYSLNGLKEGECVIIKP